MDWTKLVNGTDFRKLTGSSNRLTEQPKSRLVEVATAVEDTRRVLEYIRGLQRERSASLAHSNRAPRTESTSSVIIPSLASSLNHDVLIITFTHLVDSPLEPPPMFGSGTKGSFLNIFRPQQPTSSGHDSRSTLRACTLVSKAWYEAAVKLLWYTATLQLEHLEEGLAKWGGWGSEESVRGLESERTSKPLSSQRKTWARRLVLMGGGMSSVFSKSGPNVPLWNLWDAFSCIQHVEIFGLGWGTEELLEYQVSGSPLCFNRIQSLEITATSEYLLRGIIPGKNFLDTAGFLKRLPALRRLVLRGFTYRVATAPAAQTNPSATIEPVFQSPLSSCAETPYPSSGSPAYALCELTLDKCSVSLPALRWLVGAHSYSTLITMVVDGCSFWEDEDPHGIWETGCEETGVVPEAVFEKMISRLSIDLPVFKMSKSG